MAETPIPLYYKLYVDLKESLNSGKYQKGDKLPTEKDLCQKYGISRLTVRRAMDELRREGFIERLKGKGTFVTGSKREEQLAILTGFTKTDSSGFLPMPSSSSTFLPMQWLCY